MSVRPFESHIPQIAESVFIDESAQVIGQVVLSEGCSVWPGVILRGDTNWIKVGSYTNIQDGTVIHGNHDSPRAPGGDPTEIGSQVVIGHRAMLHACTVQDAVLIGMSATILDRVVIESEVLIAAGSLVPPGLRCESGFLYMGAPAKKIRPLTQAEVDHIYYSAKYYYKLGQRHRLSQP